MIQILSTIVEIWIYGIPLAGLVFGLIYARTSPLCRFSLRRRPYVFWCVAWPAGLAVVAFRNARARWYR